MLTRSSSDLIKIGMTLCLVSSTFVILQFFGSLGKQAYYAKEDTQQVLSVMEDAVELEPFITKISNTSIIDSLDKYEDTYKNVELNGVTHKERLVYTMEANDIIEFICNHNIKYKYRIVFNNKLEMTSDNGVNPLVCEIIQWNKRHDIVSNAYKRILEPTEHNMLVAENMLWTQQYLSDVIFSTQGHPGKYVEDGSKFKVYTTLEMPLVKNGAIVEGVNNIKIVTDIDELLVSQRNVIFNFVKLD